MFKSKCTNEILLASESESEKVKEEVLSRQSRVLYSDISSNLLPNIQRFCNGSEHRLNLKLVLKST